MTRMSGTRHVLAVKDLKKSSDYYKNQLHFSLVWESDDWAFLQRDHFFLMLGECKDDISAFDTNNHSYFAYIEMESIDELYEELTENEVEIVSPIKSQPWGQREFGIRTIDGHRIMFGEEID